MSCGWVLEHSLCAYKENNNLGKKLCVCTSVISPSSGWMSLQGPLLRAKCGWVKCDIILIFVSDYLIELVFALQFQF